jgi:sulfite exporter TauE/SafE
MGHDHAAMTGEAFGLPGEGIGLLLSMFLAGLAGGVTHCVGMCGPFVLAQVAGRLGLVAAAEYGLWARLSGAALLPYHLGRLTTYALLGAAAGGLARAVVATTAFKALLPALLAAAAGLFLVQVIAGLVPMPGARGGSAKPGHVAGMLSRIAGPLFASPTGWRGYGLGVALGFLPCGLLYGALAAAAGSGGAVMGGLAMAAFVLGTAPGLVAVAWGGRVLGGRWRGAMPLAARSLAAANAVLLLVFAVRALG